MYVLVYKDAMKMFIPKLNYSNRTYYKHKKLPYFLKVDKKWPIPGLFFFIFVISIQFTVCKCLM